MGFAYVVPEKSAACVQKMVKGARVVGKSSKSPVRFWAISRSSRHSSGKKLMIFLFLVLFHLLNKNLVQLYGSGSTTYVLFSALSETIALLPFGSSRIIVTASSPHFTWAIFSSSTRAFSRSFTSRQLLLIHCLHNAIQHSFYVGHKSLAGGAGINPHPKFRNIDCTTRTPDYSDCEILGVAVRYMYRTGSPCLSIWVSTNL